MVAARDDQRENFPSAVQFIASSTPTFCGRSAPSQRRTRSDGSVAGGSSGSPKAPGMWHRAPGRRVRVDSCPSSHNPSPGRHVTPGQNRQTCELHRVEPGCVGQAVDVKDYYLFFKGRLSRLRETSVFIKALGCVKSIQVTLADCR